MLVNPVLFTNVIESVVVHRVCLQMKVRDIIKLIEEDGWYWIKKKVVTDSINIQSKKGVLLFQVNCLMISCREP